MNNKQFFSLIVLVFISMVSFSQTKQWTLDDCINHATENNISVKQGQNNLLTSDQDIIAAKGNFVPSLSANASHSLSFGQSQLFAGSFVDRTSNSTGMGVGVTETIFNGFLNTNTYKQARLNKEINVLELERIKQDISLNVVNAYLNVLFNKENLEVAESQYMFSQKQLERISGLVDAGVQPQSNVYDAKATLAKDKQSMTIAENSYNLSLLSLSQLLQVPFEGFQVKFVVIESPSETLLYDNVNPILEYAFSNRNEIKVAEKNVENAELSTRLSKSGYLPFVSFDYGFGTNAFYSNLDTNEDAFLNQLNDNKGHNFGLNLSIPVFSRFQNKTAVAKSRIQEENSKLNLEQAKLTLESNIQRAYTDAKAAFKTYQASKKSLEAQELSFNNAQERFNIGGINSFDLDQARVGLVNAQASLINAKYDFVFKTKVLDFYLGKSLITN